MNKLTLALIVLVGIFIVGIAYYEGTRQEPALMGDTTQVYTETIGAYKQGIAEGRAEGRAALTNSIIQEIASTGGLVVGIPLEDGTVKSLILKIEQE